jgi:hypothetical protein
MKRTCCSTFIALATICAPAASYAADQLIPAGSIVQCSVAESKISSKTTAVGDPILCTLNPVEKYGRGQFPYGALLEGRFEDYKDPGHFVGKGWMQLTFDRMIVGNRVYPMSAKVVQAPKYKVDKDGRILGNGHPVRDTIEWLIPVLWPIDLINLPRRGPRPVLKPETVLTLELMQDMGIPDVNRDEQYPRQQAALVERAPQQEVAQAAPAPQQVIYQTFQQAPQQAPAPVMPQVVYNQQYYQPPPVVVRPRVVYPAYPVYPSYAPGYYRYGYGPGY